MPKGPAKNGPQCHVRAQTPSGNHSLPNSCKSRRLPEDVHDNIFFFFYFGCMAFEILVL